MKIQTYKDLEAFQVLETRKVMVCLDQPLKRHFEHYVLASIRDEAVEDRNKWIRAANSLEKAVENFLNLDHRADEKYLETAHKAFLREVAKK
jgi:hypothetical protein